MSDDVAAFGVYSLPPAAEHLRRLAEHLGPGAIARRVRSGVRRLLCLRRGPFDVEPFHGQRARLYPADNLSDKRVFAAPGLWDRAERAALGRAIRAAEDPAFFVDAGANAGLYTLAVRAEAGDKRLRVLAIEPDPENLERLGFNVRASGADRDVFVAPVALSDRSGTMRIATNHANRGELTADPGGTPVATRPLLELVREAGFPRVDALKIDIEGMELPVVSHYFQTAPRAMWPTTIVLEARRGEETPTLAHLVALGYRIEERTRLNAILNAPAEDSASIEVTGNAHVDQA